VLWNQCQKWLFVLAVCSIFVTCCGFQLFFCNCVASWFLAVLNNICWFFLFKLSYELFLLGVRMITHISDPCIIAIFQCKHMQLLTPVMIKWQMSVVCICIVLHCVLYDIMTELDRIYLSSNQCFTQMMAVQLWHIAILWQTIYVISVSYICHLFCYCYFVVVHVVGFCAVYCWMCCWHN